MVKGVLIFVGLLALPFLVILVIGVSPFAMIYFVFQLILNYKSEKQKREMKFNILEKKRNDSF